jgi:Helix-turn-helix domain
MQRNPPVKPGQRRTIPLWPDAGQALGLSRNGTYDAAHRKEIPVLRFGRKFVVPIEQFERLLAEGRTAE